MKNIYDIYQGTLNEEENTINVTLRTIFRKALGFYRFRSGMVDVGKSLDFGQTEKTMKVDNRQIRAGRAIRMFYPDLTDTELNDILGEIKKYYFNDIGWALAPNIVYAYKLCAKSGIESCMTCEDELLKFYEWAKCRVLVLMDNKTNTPLGRAIVWMNTTDENGRTIELMDRIYPSFNNKIVAKFKEFADKQKWAYRESQDADDTNIVMDEGQVDVTLQFKVGNYYEKFPFMDTMRYCCSDRRKKYLTNDIKDPNYDFELTNTDGTNYED